MKKELKVIKAVKNIRWSHVEDGAAFYKAGDGECWYKHRNELNDDPIIQVDAKTNRVLCYQQGLPSDHMSIFITMHTPELVVHVYQLAEFDETVTDPHGQGHIVKENVFFDGKYLTYTPPVQIKRTKEDIMADLEALRAELKAL